MRKGFTLAELLIALLILGVVATFTIPKILQSNANSQRKAVFRETLATLADMTHQRAQGDQNFASIAEVKTWFSQNLNYVKRCPANPTAEGCWSAAVGGNAGNADGYLLHNGAFISSINGGGLGTGFDRETILVDWNGLNPPNTYGDDIIGLVVCVGPTSCDGGGENMGGNGPKGPGSIGPSTAGTSITLYAEIFSD